jgi:hypothetical protein
LEAANAVPYTGMLEALSEFTVREPVMKALKNDASKFFDIVSHAQFNATPLRVGASTTTSIVLSTAGTCTTTNSQAFNTTHHKLIMDLMRERDIPSYQGDDYVALARPSGLRTFKNNLETIKSYTTEGLHMLFNGEIGRYEKCRFVEQTNIPTGGAANSTTFDPYTRTGDAWDVAGTAGADWIFFMGEDTVAEAVVCPEETRAKIPGDYGRSKGVAWYYLGGFGIVHTSAAQARIVKWDSAV